MTKELLGKLGEMEPFERIFWPYETEPTNLSKNDYNLAHMPITGTPYWEESDESYRNRLKNKLEKPHGRENS